MLSKVAELVSDVSRHEGEMTSMAQEILTKGTQLDKLASSFKEVAEALKTVSKNAPQ
jgi:hypothetical protein